MGLSCLVALENEQSTFCIALVTVFIINLKKDRIEHLMSFKPCVLFSTKRHSLALRKALLSQERQ